MKRSHFISRVLVILLLYIPLLVLAGPGEDLISACKKGDMEGVQKALSAGADVNFTDADGNTPVSMAFFWPEITSLLLEKGADPNKGVYPALISTCNNYSVEAAKLLLDAGADPNKTGMSDPGVTFRTLIAAEKAKGKDANKIAIKTWEGLLTTMKPTEVELMRVLVQQTNCVPCLEMVLEKGANLVLKDGNTAIDVLASFSMSQKERREAFAKGAASVEAFGFKVPDWYRNLPDEINGPATEMLDALMLKGADLINKPNTIGLTPLVVALKSCNATEEGIPGKLAVVKRMVEKGAYPTISASQKFDKGEANYYPVCLAAQYGDVDLMNVMLDKGADINSATSTACLSMYNGTWGGEGYTPLIISIMVKNYPVAKFLIEKGADLKTGTTGFAIMETAVQDVKCLVSVKNKTPVYWAVEKDDMELVKLIADRMVWKFNPDFTFNVISDVSSVNMGTYSVGCKKGKEKLFPSAYASELGNKEAAKYLSGKGL